MGSKEELTERRSLAAVVVADASILSSLDIIACLFVVAYCCSFVVGDVAVTPSSNNNAVIL